MNYQHKRLKLIIYSITIFLSLLQVEMLAQTITITPEEGFYSDSVVVNVSGNLETDSVYFSLDGNNPLVNGILIVL
jgi:hypothetical protein